MGLETVLATAVRAGVLLALLTPLVVTPATIFPYVVGKALYLRSVAEVTFALWVVLAAIAPAYRPRRSVVLALLAVVVIVSAASALTGVSVMRSLWSSYERMQGVIDLLHWSALALVAACVLRTTRQWTVLLSCNVAVAAVVGLLAVAQKYGLSLPFYGEDLLPKRPRPSSTLGNPIFLAAYLMVNVVLAAGLLAHSRVAAAAPTARDGSRSSRVARRTLQLMLLGTGLLGVWVMILAGSRGPVLGAAFALVAVAAAAALASRRRRTAFLAVVVVAVTLSVASAPLIGPAVAPQEYKALTKRIDRMALRRLLLVDFDRGSVHSRLVAWTAALDGLAARPWLGWGPENYVAVFGRYGADLPPRMQPHDSAHSALLDALAATGGLGGAAHLALWAALAVVAVRAARRSRGADRIVPLTVGAALAGHLAATQTLFATTVGAMQFAVLLACVAHLEWRRDHGRHAAVPTVAARAWPAWGVWTAAAAAGSLAVAALWANGAIHAAAAAAARATAPAHDAAAARHRYARAIEAFPPLANDVRLIALRDFGTRLGERPQDIDAALPWLEREAARAVAAEPSNWLLLDAIAYLYTTLAETRPGRLPDAELAVRRTLTAAPGHRGALSLFGRPPAPLGVRLAPAPRGVVIDWPQVAWALTYELQQRRRRGRWTTVYDGVATEALVVPDPPRRQVYRLRACRGSGNCSPWAKRIRLDWTPAAPDG